MEKILKDLEAAIEKSQTLPIEERRTYLEPFFDDVYHCLRENDNIDFSILLKVSQIENELSIRMIEAHPKIEPSLDSTKEEQLIEQIVYYTRRKATEVYNCNIDKDSLRTRSFDFSNLVLEFAKSLQVPATLIDIGAYFHFPYPHSVVIAYARNEFYLIDCTYQQFFMLGYNFKNRYYKHPSYVRICEIGGRMLEKDRKEVAKKLITEGYLKVSSSDFKIYCDVLAEFGSGKNEENSVSYLKAILKEIERSSDKNDRILVSKLQYL